MLGLQANQLSGGFEHKSRISVTLLTHSKNMNIIWPIKPVIPIYYKTILVDIFKITCTYLVAHAFIQGTKKA
jgi:hypothetical protein